MPNSHEGHAVDGSQPAHDGRVVQPSSVTMQLHKAVTDIEDDVQEGGPVWVPGNLEALHWGQPGVCVPPQLQEKQSMESLASLMITSTGLNGP